MTADPEHQAALGRWSSCMSTRTGRQYAAPEAVATEVDTMNVTPPLLDGSSTSADALLAADDTCQDQSGLAKVRAQIVERTVKELERDQPQLLTPTSAAATR